MNTPLKIGVVSAVILLGVVGIFVAKTTNNSDVKSASTTDSSSRSITSTEVANHTTESDCWTIIDGAVYDLTSYIPRHEGGDNILSACGADATAYFNGEKAGKLGDSKKHAGSARSDLSRLKIGTLSQ